MTSNITSIDKKRKIRQGQEFINKYPRIERSNNEMLLLDDEQCKHDMEDIPSEGIKYAAVKDTPVDEFSLLFEIEASWLNNSVLIYRILSGIYGKFDKLSLALDEKTQSGSLLNWGYVVQLSNDLIAEVRTKSIRKIVCLRFWRRSPLSETKLDATKRDAKDFSKRLEGLIEQNSACFNEGEVKKNSLRTGKANIFQSRYDSAQRLLEVAKDLDGPTHDWLDRSLNGKPITTGTIYFSASMMFHISLEALVNVLYDQLLKDEFRDKVFNHHLNADLKIKLCMMHLYCRGFERAVLTKGDDLWRQYDDVIKPFRNHYFHGNVSQEDQVYAFAEDGLIFYYSPSESSKKDIRSNKIRSNNLAFSDEPFVENIRSVVDLTLERILAAMNDESKCFLESWVHDSLIKDIQ